MSYRGQNSVAGTVQYWDGTSWVSFDNLVLSTTGTDAVLTAASGNLVLAAGANDINMTCATFNGTFSDGMVLTSTGGTTIIQNVAGGNTNVTGFNALLQGQGGTASVLAQTNLILTSSAGNVSLQAIGGSTAISAATGMTLSTGAGTLAISGPTTTITATTSLVLNAGVAMTWPAADGSSGHVLTTNGAGVLSFQPVAAGAASYLVVGATSDPAPSAATLQTNQITYACDSSGGAFSVTLPNPIPVSGTRAIVKDAVGSAAANPITVNGNGINIDGAGAQNVATNYGSMTLQSNGTTWMII